MSGNPTVVVVVELDVVVVVVVGRHDPWSASRP
jgi:hypothetical protein